MWLLLAVALIALPFASLPGRYVFDTRDPLWLDPGAYLSKAFVLWHSSPLLGHEQHDAIAFPMALIVWLLRLPGTPAWAAERLWHGLLLFAGAGGTILLLDHLRGRRTVAAPLAAGVAYALTPYTFGYGLPFTGPYLPYVLLPTLLLVTLKGLPHPGFRWPAAFGLVMFLMGGGNGAPQVYALITASLLIAWVALVQRGVHLRRAVAFAGSSLLFVVGLDAHWLFLLGSKEVSNALSFSEQPNVINVSSSASETVRGLGFWMFYGGDQFGPWVPTVRAYATNPVLILTGFALPVAAIASAWLVRWRYRLFFVFLFVVAVFVTAGVFPVHSPTPFGRLLLRAYHNVPGAAGLRTTYKFGDALNLAVAVLVGIGLGGALDTLRRLPRGRLLASCLAAGAFLVLAANAYPLWTGHLYPLSRSTATIPRYWERALADLGSRDIRMRAFFAPATSSAIYRWGALKEGIGADAPARLSHVDPIRLPVGERFGSNLVAAVEDAYFHGLPMAGEAQLFRYLGVRDVVLQSDLDWQRSHTARPFQLQELLRNPSLQPFSSYGIPGRNVVADGAKDPLSASEQSLAPVQILTVARPSPIVRAETSDPVIVSGDGFGIAEAARAGLLPEGAPIVYSASLSPEELRGLFTRSTPAIVVTDSNRREVWSFATPESAHSFTLPAGVTLHGRTTGYGLFDERSSTQSVARYPGLASITSSGIGSALTSDPAFRPANAFDGDPDTWWAAGQGGDPLGSWVRASFTRPRSMSSVRVTVPAQLGRQVRLVRLEFSNGKSVIARVPPGQTTTINFPSLSTRFLLVRITGVTQGAPTWDNAVAIADVTIPGMRPGEIIRVPNDLFGALGTLGENAPTLTASPLSYVFERARTGSTLDRDEEVSLRRQFIVPAPRMFSLSGTVGLKPTATDREIDRVLIGPSRVRATASSRMAGDPRRRGSAAFDGNENTEWQPASPTGESLTISFPPHKVGGLTIDTDLSKDRTPILGVRATLSNGTSVDGQLKNLLDGTIRLAFRPQVISSVSFTTTSVFTTSDAPPRPVGVREVHVPGVRALSFHDSAPLPCFDGGGFTIDGARHSIQPSGTQGQLLEGKQLPLSFCGGSRPVLLPGSHLLVADGPLLPDEVVMSGPGSSPPPSGEMAPTVRVTPTTSGFSVRIEGASHPFYLVIGQNLAPGWHASAAGHDLGPPILLDGYSAGWFVSRLGSYTMDVHYGPQTAFNRAIALSGLTLVVALVLIAAETHRGRRSRTRTPGTTREA